MISRSPTRVRHPHRVVNRRLRERIVLRGLDVAAGNQASCHVKGEMCTRAQQRRHLDPCDRACGANLVSHVADPVRIGDERQRLALVGIAHAPVVLPAGQ